MGTNPYEARVADTPAATLAHHRVIEADNGSRLAIARARRLPRVCLMCGAKKRVKFEKETVYLVSPIAWVSLLFGLSALVAFKLFASAGLVKMAPLELPRCESCIALRERAAMFQGPILIGFIVGLLAAATLAGNGFPVAGIVVAVISFVWVFFAAPRWGSPKRVKATRIDDEEIVLSGVHADALDAIARRGDG